MENQKLFLYAALGVLLLLIVQAWDHDHQGPPPPVASAVPTAPAPGQVAVAIGGSNATAQPPALAAAPGGAAVTVSTDVLRAHLNTTGADLQRLAILQYPKATGSAAPYHLFRTVQKPLFYTETGLIGSQDLPTHASSYQVHHHHYQLAPGHNSLHVRFYWQGAGGLRVVKDYVFHRGSYIVDLRYELKNQGTAPVTIYPYAQFLRTRPPKPGHFHTTPIYLGGALYTPASKYQKVTFSDIAKQPLKVSSTQGWVAMSQHYFVAAFIPPPNERVDYYSSHLKGGRYLLGYKAAEPLTLAAGASGTIDSRLFAGPKQPALLRAAAPGLDLTVDYGWLTVLAVPLYWVLAHIESVIGNWGWAIVLLTVAIKLLFFPLSAASYRSMAKMRKLQPRVDALRERHGDDRQTMQKAMMELYRAEKMNPLGGCLPMVVQIPVFIALYWVLLESVELRQAPFMLWIHDLSAPDPYFVLPVLMGITMVFQQLLNPTMNIDPMQRKIMLALPVVFTVFFLFFPAGLVLYWVVSNLLSIVQQWWITRVEAAR